MGKYETYTIWNVDLMSFVICISSFLECLIHEAKRLTTTKTKIKFQFLEVFFMMHDFLDMPKYFSNQFIITLTRFQKTACRCFQKISFKFLHSVIDFIKCSDKNSR